MSITSQGHATDNPTPDGGNHMDRREFLKVSMGAGMLALLHGGVLTGCTGNSTQEKIKPLL